MRDEQQGSVRVSNGELLQSSAQFRDKAEATDEPLTDSSPSDPYPVPWV